MGLAVALLTTLVLTIAIEVPVAAALGLRTKSALLAVALINLITNPVLNYSGDLLANFVDWGKSPLTALAVLVPAELLVVFVEWRMLVWVLDRSSRRLFGVSFAMNTASALAGLVLWVR